tara:strand:+ start:9175 stop:10074 length:900 start_codon:yes stop_codon:yes gene_type:complete
MIAFYLLISVYSGFEDIIDNFSSANFIFIPIIIGIVLSSILIRSFIQKLLLDELDIELSIKQNFLLYLSGLALIISPGGTGQIIKSYFLKEQHGISISKTIPIVIFERYYDLIGVTTLVLVSVSLIFSIESFLISILALVIISIISIAIKKELFFKRLLSFQKKIIFMKKLEIEEDEFFSSMKSLRKFSVSWKIALLTVLVTFWDGIAIYLGFHTFEINVGYLEATQFYYTSIMIGVMSFIPGGMGVVESGFTILSSKYLEIATGVSVIIFIRLTTIWFSTFLGICTSFRELFRRNEIK